MQNKSIVSQAFYAIVGALLGALFIFALLGAINKTYAKDIFDDCHDKCTLSIPWCYSWKRWGCEDWGKKCLEHKLVCEVPDPTPSPIPCEQTEEGCPVPSVTPSPVPLSEAHGCRESCEKHVEPPVCSKVLPSKPSFTFVPVYPNGLTMNWFENDENTTNWAISYGYSQEDLNMGVPFLPMGARSYTIQGVDLNRHVWMQLHRFNTGECRVSSDIVDP